MKQFFNKVEAFFAERRFAAIAAAGLLGAIFALGGSALFSRKNSQSQFNQNNSTQLAKYAALNTQPAFDFVGVSDLATPAVVHIKTTIGTTRSNDEGSMEEFDPFEFFRNNPGFRIPQGPRQASGSGVILSDDGFIVTNNHVIDGATKIEVILNDKRTYVAELIGADKNTDLAVIKITESGLPFLKVGNSDEVKVGQWVVAVGNPFNLTSTVTAGIVSAKGRNIDLLRSKGAQYAIESFIQTDAAVNPGNSGGALVNTAGELIGINTAIASETGSYAGYAFAVPANLMTKVVKDLRAYGKVQRGLLGVSIQDINQQLADEKDLPDLKGVYVNEVREGTAAKKAGIKNGDVILKINGIEVNSSARLQEEVGKNKPGDIVKITLRRGGTVSVVEATLLSENGSSSLESASNKENGEYLGLKLENTNSEDRKKLNIRNGVRVKNVSSGVFADAGIPNDFIITHIDNEAVYSVQSAISVLKSLKGAVTIEGKTSNGGEKVYAVKLPSKKTENQE